MRLMKRPESLVDELAAVLIAPAILWILVVCWVFGGNRGARKAYLWMFAERDSSNNAVSGGAVAPYTPRAGSGCGCLRCTRESGRTVNGLPEEMTRMIVCPRCGNKRCPHASDHRNYCTNSNELGQPGSVYGPNPGIDGNGSDRHESKIG